MRILTTLLLITIIASCSPEVEDGKVAEAYTTIKKMKPNTTITPDTVRVYMAKASLEPCQHDYNLDGVVNTADLTTLLSGYATASDIVAFLPSYGEEYIIDVIPAWNNFIQDFNCNLGWDVFVRRQCNGEISSYAEFDSLKWISGKQVLSTSREKLDFQNYDGNEPILSCPGWTPPCNGINTVTMRVYNQGNVFERTAEGWVRTNSFPDEIPVCGFPSVPNLFGNEFLPYEFLVE